MNFVRLKAHVDALNAQITELGSICHAQRHRAEAAEAELEALRRKPEMLVADTVRLHLQVNSLTQTLEAKEAYARDLSAQVSSLIRAVEEKEPYARDLSAQVSSLTRAIKEKEAYARDLSAQVSSLIQAVEEKEAYARDLSAQVNSLNRVAEEWQREAASVFQQLNQVLHSHSWRLTRPLRVAMRFIRHGHLGSAGERSLFQFARYIGNQFPFPVWLKARARTALLRRRFGAEGDIRAFVQEKNIPHPDVRPMSTAARKYDVMRAECCGLRPGLVSVVLPVYNQAYLLDESIQSVLAQTYGDLELIVVNDGSTDGVEEILQRYVDHPKVRCYTQANQRLPKALSNGFSFATGEFWTWTSADNIMEPRMLELLVGKLRAEPDLGMVYADYYAIDDRGSLLQDPTWRPHNRPDPKSGEIRPPRTTETLNIEQDNFIGPCFMYRGWIGRTLGDYDPQLGIEDYDYWMRINAFFKIRHLGGSDLLYRYRVHDNTLSAQASEHRILEKVQRLMTYEAERARFYRKAPVVLADGGARDWLRAAGVDAAGAGDLTDAAGALLEEDAGKAELLVLASETATRHIGRLATLATPTAIIFRPGDGFYQRLQRLLNRPGCIAVVSSPVDAARVRLVAACPVIDSESAQAYGVVLAFAKNHLFFHSTRAQEELKRVLPRQLLRPARQHVLLQVDSFTQGGMENVVIDLGLSLKSAGFEVTIGNLGQSGDAVAKARERNLRVEEFAGGVSEGGYLEWLKQHGVSLVNAHYSIFGAAFCHEAGIPFIETIHNSYVWLDPETIQKYRAADQHIAQYLCVSNTAAQYADVVLGLDVAKMRVVPNGIDRHNVDATHFEVNRGTLRQQWKVALEAPVFLNVASIMATKAQLPLVRAFAQVVKKRPDARLVLLGSVMEKPYQRAIEQAVKDLNLQDHVIFAGYQREVVRYYHAADVFVLPSYWEGWSLSLGEAMANGLSCVITDVGSAYEFEGHGNVRIVAPPFGDITQLNYLNLGKFVYEEDSEFEQNLADALMKTVNFAGASIDQSLASRLDSRAAYQRYIEIFLEYSVG